MRTRSPEFNGRSSSQIAELKKRLPKAWDFVDWALSKQNQNTGIKKEVALELIKKAVPNKIDMTGDFNMGHYVITLEKRDVLDDRRNGNRLASASGATEEVH